MSVLSDWMRDMIDPGGEFSKWETDISTKCFSNLFQYQGYFQGLHAAMEKNDKSNTYQTAKRVKDFGIKS